VKTSNAIFYRELNKICSEKSGSEATA